VEWSELYGELVKGLLRYIRCKLLLLGAEGIGRGTFENTEEEEFRLLESALQQWL
jgi:hypothetical protein